MPPKRRAAKSTVMRPQPSRASKDKAKKVIQSATMKHKTAPPKKRAPRGRRTSPSPDSPTSSSSTSSSESPWEGIFTPPPDSRHHPQPLPDKETLTDMIRGAVETILAEKSSTGQEAPLGRGSGTASQSGMAPYPLPAILSTGLPHHILLRWPWVDTETVNLIQLGKFDIDALPKLHQSDQMRNAYVKKSVQGILHPLSGGPAEVLIGNTKLQASFKDSTSFFLAWQIYVSIRTTFHPDRAAGLAFWTERLHFFISLNYPWTGILEYIIAFYKLNQNSAPDIWFDSNPTLISHCLTLHQQQPVSAVPGGQNSDSTSSGKNTKSMGAKTTSRASVSKDEICIMFNREIGCIWPQRHGGEKCPRRHSCSICASDQHNAVSCPKRSIK
jgi:hypothetical protein